MPSHPPASRQCGAALLVLLAMVGLGSAALLISVIKRVGDDRMQAQGTLQRLGEAREALLGYAAVHGRLPRPATSPLDGKETPLPCDTAESCNGFIPWVTLGVSNSDSWGNLLRYSVTPAFTTAPLGPLTAGDKVVTGRTSTGLNVYLAGLAHCEAYAQCPPAVIFSSGKYNLGTSKLGAQRQSATTSNTDERQNNTSASHFISRPQSVDENVAGGTFDDLVTWVPINQFNARLRATYTR